MSLTHLFAAIFAGFVFTAPFGVIGATAAVAVMSKRKPYAIQLASGVMCADAIVTISVVLLLGYFPQFSLAEVKDWPFWWGLVIALTVAGIYFLRASPAQTQSLTLEQKSPFLFGLGWTLAANPKNWLATTALFLGWKLADSLSTPQQIWSTAGAFWLGGLISWVLWIILARRARAYQHQVRKALSVVMGVLCLAAAVAAAYVLSHP